MPMTRYFILASLCLLPADLAPASDRPNIVFILADDLGYGDLSCYGQEHFETPRIDTMAKEGLRFTQHYAGSTVCAPSRACLLSGQHTGHVHQRANGKIEFRPDPLDRCIASYLQEAGYATAMIGKSGLSCNGTDPLLPNKKGFDHFFGFISHGAAHRYYPRSLWRNGEKVSYAENHEKEGQVYSGDLFLEESLSWIESNHSQPFFLFFSPQQPHLDLNVPDQWKQPFLGKFDEVPLAGGHYRAEANPKATFAGMISHLDDSVGQILDKLKELGIEQNTLVLFSSDNGAVTAGGWSSENFQSSGPLRGCKRDLYEGGIRVPLVAWWPETIRAGRTTDHVSAFWDFAPTAYALTKTGPVDDTDGISFLPTLLGQGKQVSHEFLYWEFYERGGKQAVRMNDWKGVRLDVLSNPKAPVELYNLSEDLGEESDVAANHPEVVASIEKIMQREHVPTEEFSLAGPAEVPGKSNPRVSTRPSSSQD